MIFAHMKPLPFFSSFFLTFDLFLGAFWHPKCLKKRAKNVFEFLPFFWLAQGAPTRRMRKGGPHEPAPLGLW